MLRIHCQGCERYVDVEANERLNIILEVEVRENGFTGRNYKADLCMRCREQLLAKYFGVMVGERTLDEDEAHALMGPPAMPRFLEPELDTTRAENYLERGYDK